MHVDHAKQTQLMKVVLVRTTYVVADKQGRRRPHTHAPCIIACRRHAKKIKLNAHDHKSTHARPIACSAAPPRTGPHVRVHCTRTHMHGQEVMYHYVVLQPAEMPLRPTHTHARTHAATNRRRDTP